MASLATLESFRRRGLCRDGGGDGGDPDGGRDGGVLPHFHLPHHLRGDGSGVRHPLALAVRRPAGRR